MDDGSKRSLMWVDLFTSNLEAESAGHRVTQRALIYLDSGLPLGDVLEALKISRATWYRRVEALEAWRTTNGAAARRLTGEGGVRDGHLPESAPGVPHVPAAPSSPRPTCATGEDTGGTCGPGGGEAGAARG